MKWNVLWNLSVHSMSLKFDHTCCFDKSELEMCLRLPASENRSRRLRSESSFLFPFLPMVQFDVVHQRLDLSCRQHVLNLHVLVFLDTWDYSDTFLLCEPLLLMVLRHHRFPFRHLHSTGGGVPCRGGVGPRCLSVLPKGCVCGCGLS